MNTENIGMTQDQIFNRFASTVADIGSRENPILSETVTSQFSGRWVGISEMSENEGPSG